MVSSAADTVAEYLDELAPERRETVGAVRDVILENLPDGFEETMQYGMISYVVPLARYPETYNGRPLAYVSLASQKRHVSLYLMCIYGSADMSAWFTQRWNATGKKLDKGKSCVRFTRAADVPLDLIGEAVAKTGPEDFIAMYEASRRR